MRPTSISTATTGPTTDTGCDKDPAMRVPRVRFRLRTLMILIAVAAFLMLIFFEIEKASKRFHEYYFPRPMTVKQR